MSQRSADTVSVQGLGELDARIYRRWVEVALTIAAIGYGSVLVATLVFTPRPMGYAVGPAVVLVVSLGSLALTRAGYMRTVVLVCLLAIWLDQVSTIPVRGVIGDYGVVGLPVLVLGVGIVFGRRAAFAAAGLSVLVTTGGVLFSHAVRGVPTDRVGEEAFILVVTAAAMFATAALVSAAMRAFASVLDEARVAGQHLADLIAHAPDGMVVLDAGGRVVAANPAAEVILRSAEADLVGRKLVAILEALGAQSDRASLADLVRPSEGGGPAVVRCEADARTQWCEVTSRTFSDDGEVRTHVMLRDVTRRQQAIEEQRLVRDRLEEAHRLEAVGRLAGGIAHDFRNLITVVCNSAELIGEGAEGEVKELADDIRRAGDRASKLTAQLLAFARREIIQTTSVSFHDLMEPMELGIRHLLGPGVQLELHLDPGVPRVMADRLQLEQILYSLVRNAGDALGGVGRVHVSLAGPGKKARGLAGSFPEVPSGFMEIRVSDDGPGMDAGTLERAFEPFFTTKPVGVGTGLGLSSVHGIVVQNGGQVSIESRPGEGASVRILWPLDAAPPPLPVTT